MTTQQSNDRSTSPEPASLPPEGSMPPPAEETRRGANPPPRHPGYYTGPAMPDGPRPKSPALACILSIVPGLGQIYVGYYGLGFLHAVVAAGVFTLMLTGPDFAIFPMLVIFFIFFMLYNIVDAGRRAALYNLAIAGVPGVELPPSMKVPRFAGSIFGGGVLILASFLLLLHTKFRFSLDWIEEWWPVAPMLFGAYLVMRAIQDRSSAKNGS